jgi:WD40 repeat protein
LVQLVNGDTKAASLTFQASGSANFYSMSWSPDGTRLAVGGASPTVEIWDTSSGKIVQQLEKRENMGHMAWSPDGKLIATAGDGLNDSALIWDAATGQILFSPQVGEADSIAWSPDSKIVAFGRFADIQFWSMTTQQKIQTIDLLISKLSLAWSSDGTKIASADTDPTAVSNARIHVWDVNTGQLLSTLIGHTNTVMSVKWNMSGDRLLSASADGTVRVWDAGTGETLETYQGKDPILDASFSPYGGRVAFADAAVPESKSTATQDFVSDLIQIVVPAPSIGQLQKMADTCKAPSALKNLLTTTSTPLQVQVFANRIGLLPAGTIPSACAADLVAVADALQTK